jgi:hypothetical protein
MTLVDKYVTAEIRSQRKQFYILDKIIVANSSDVSVTKFICQDKECNIIMIEPADIVAVIDADIYSR